VLNGQTEQLNATQLHVIKMSRHVSPY